MTVELPSLSENLDSALKNPSSPNAFEAPARKRKHGCTDLVVQAPISTQILSIHPAKC